MRIPCEGNTSVRILCERWIQSWGVPRFGSDCHQVQGRLLLDVVVGKRAAVFKLFSREDEALLVGGDALLILERCVWQE